MNEEIKALLNEINELNLRTKDWRSRFDELLSQIIKDNKLFTELNRLYIINENSISTFKQIWKQMLQTDNWFDKQKFIDAWLTSKRTRYKITISDENYINNWYSLLTTDFVNNFETYWNWIFDYSNNEYIIKEDEMKVLLDKLNVLKFSYNDKKISRSMFSYNLDFDNINTTNINYTDIYKTFWRKSEQDKFIVYYSKFLEQNKIYKKIFDKYKEIMRDIFLHKLNEKWFLATEFDPKESFTKSEWLIDIRDYLLEHENFVLDWRDLRQKWNKSQKINYLFTLTWRNIKFKWKYTESFEKEVEFNDLRKTETRTKLSHTMTNIKNELAQRKFYENCFVKQSNTFITELKPTNFKDKKEFEDTMNTDKYKEIIKVSEYHTLK